MDMQLGDTTGQAATEWIMAHCPTPILVVSASTNRGELLHTYAALAAGAVDVLEKPTGKEPPGDWEGRFRAALKMVSRTRVITHLRARFAREAAPLPLRGISPVRTPRVVGIGASTGGPGAVLTVLKGLPDDFQTPILLVIHIGERFSGALAEWLDSELPRPVAWPVEGQPLAALSGRVVVAKAGAHLVVRGGCVVTERTAERHACRPPVDVLFESLAEGFGPACTGVLLTGMGRDGAEGLRDMRRAGGATIAQDEASSVVYGMPREAARIGAAERIVPLDRIAGALARPSQGEP